MMGNLAEKAVSLKPLRRNRFTKGRWAFVWFSISVLAALALLRDMTPVMDYRATKSRIQELVPIGSDIDAAEAVLTDAGFVCFPKHFADVGQDSYWVEVKIAYGRRSTVADILGHLQIYLYYNYVVIEAGLDNRVRKVF